MNDTPHQVIFVDGNRDPRYRYTAQYAYCAKPGCNWRWDGIGRYEHAKQQHEQMIEAANDR